MKSCLNAWLLCCHRHVTVQMALLCAQFSVEQQDLICQVVQMYAYLFASCSMKISVFDLKLNWFYRSYCTSYIYSMLLLTMNNLTKFPVAIWRVVVLTGCTAQILSCLQCCQANIIVVDGFFRKRNLCLSNLIELSSVLIKYCWCNLVWFHIVEWVSFLLGVIKSSPPDMF